MAAGKGQYSSIWKCSRCACTQGAWGSTHSSLPFLVTRLPGENQRWGTQPGQRGACAGSHWQRPRCPWPCPLPPPGHPRTRLGLCPDCCTLTPSSVGYSHHRWLCALAAGPVGGGDEPAWDGVLRVAEATAVCGGRETAPVRPHTAAEALPGAPRGFAITCAVSPRDTPWKPPSPRAESQHW